MAMRSWAGVHLLASDSRGLVTLMRLLRDPSTSFSEEGGLQDVRHAGHCPITLEMVPRGKRKKKQKHCLSLPLDLVVYVVYPFNL